MKKYIIMFGITLIISTFLIFYNPNKKYLGIYKDEITIKYEMESCVWSYKLSNNNLKLVNNYKKAENEEVWKFKINQTGEETLTFDCQENGTIKYSIFYRFKIEKNNIIWTEGEATGLLDYPNPE